MLHLNILLLLQFQDLLLGQICQETDNLNDYFGIALAAEVQILELLVRNRYTLQIYLVTQKIYKDAKIDLSVHIGLDMIRDRAQLLRQIICRDPIILQLLETLLIFKHLCQKLINLPNVVLSLDTLILINCFFYFFAEDILLNLLGIVLSLLLPYLLDKGHAHEDVVAEEVEQLR